MHDERPANGERTPVSGAQAITFFCAFSCAFGNFFVWPADDIRVSACIIGAVSASMMHMMASERDEAAGWRDAIVGQEECALESSERIGQENCLQKEEDSAFLVGQIQ